MHIRTKICGITRIQDAICVANCGADAIGLVFYPDSPRYVNCQTAKQIIQALPPFISVVGLFVNPSSDYVTRVIETLPIDYLQFQGDEDENFCTKFKRPYIKAIRVCNRQDIENALQQYQTARALLFDAYHPQQYGGSGKHFDWNILPDNIKNRTWILAGGLNSDNIVQAITTTRTLNIDISSGVESDKGIKDAQKIKQFMQQIRKLEQSLPETKI
ncbi:MAG: phosphoribosylanthranilate isomerase [Neisseriaceae bacterium]|nr:phosphoribosylanthranilate isomerase [Neisseriaceae bacterium]